MFVLLVLVVIVGGLMTIPRIRREIFPELEDLHGDQGARTLFCEQRPDVLEIAVGGKPPPDIDTPDDFARIAPGPRSAG